MCILYHHENEKISKFTNNFDHIHVNSKASNSWGIDSKIKTRINELFTSGVCMPNTIRYTLREENFDEPTQRQLYNFLSQLKEKLYGKKQVSYGVFEKWCRERTKIPEDEHEVYILGYEVIINDAKPELSYFRISIGTIYLLRLALKSIHLVADSTHCMIWNGFPVFLTGTTDFARRFHPFCLSVCTNEDNGDFTFIFETLKRSVLLLFKTVYSHSILMADAAASITIAFTVVFGSNFLRLMCYCHVERACARRLNGNEDKDDIIHDLQVIQISFSQALFNLMIQLFKIKWAKYSDFLNYFVNEWVNQNSLWYEGASFNLATPSQNNALESTHYVVKNQHTLRQRLALIPYFSNAFKMIKNMSLDRVNVKIFQSEVHVANELFEIAFTWIFEYKCSINQIINQSNYLVCKEKNKHLLLPFEHLVVYSSCNLEFDDLGKKIKTFKI